MATAFRQGRVPAGIWLSPLLAVALALQIAAQAQDQFKPSPLNPHNDRMVCPLSDSQTQNSIDAFAKMMPTFHQKRCSNCHGGVDPFANPTNHGGGTIDASGRAQMDDGFCNQCHYNLPPNGNGTSPVWKLPFLPQHSFVNRDALTLCKIMRGLFLRGVDFEFHILDDNGNTNFEGVAFLGTRGVPDVTPEPIQGITLGQFFNQAEAWVETTGGEFKGDERCGCEKLQFGLQVYYIATIKIGSVVQQVTTMGPVTIPIKFDDEGHYEGTGTLPISGAGQVRAPRGGCNSETQGGLQIKVSGNAVEENKDNHMQINLTNVTPATGTTGVQCPMYSRVFPLRGGDKAEFDYKVRGKIDDSDVDRVPLPGPINAILRVQVVDLSPDAAPAQ
jgi:hypothetical protein